MLIKIIKHIKQFCFQSVLDGVFVILAVLLCCGCNPDLGGKSAEFQLPLKNYNKTVVKTTKPATKYVDSPLKDLKMYVFFDNYQHCINRDNIESLQMLGVFADQYKIPLLIQGFSDALNESENISLSKNRAIAVRDFLINRHPNLKITIDFRTITHSQAEQWKKNYFKVGEAIETESMISKRLRSVLIFPMYRTEDFTNTQRVQTDDEIVCKPKCECNQIATFSASNKRSNVFTN